MTFHFEWGKPDPFMQSVLDEVYYDPWRRIDKRPLVKEGEKLKAVWTVETAAVTSPKFIPIYLMPDYVLAVPSDFPFQAAIPRKAVQGATVDYWRVTALGSGAAARAEGWEPTDAETTIPTTARETRYLRTVGAAGKVSGLAIQSGKGYFDALATLMQIKMTDVLTILESYLCSGDGAATPAQPQGFIPLQGTTNQTDKAAAAVTLADIRESLRLAFVGGGNLENNGFAVTDPVTYNAVKALLTAYLHYDPPAYHLPWGIKTYEVDGVPFLKCRGMPTGAGVKVILFLDKRVVFSAYSLEPVFESMGKIGDSERFLIKCYVQNVNQAPEFCAKIINIA